MTDMRGPAWLRWLLCLSPRRVEAFRAGNGALWIRLIEGWRVREWPLPTPAEKWVIITRFLRTPNIRDVTLTSLFDSEPGRVYRLSVPGWAVAPIVDQIECHLPRGAYR